MLKPHPHCLLSNLHQGKNKFPFQINSVSRDSWKLEVPKWIWTLYNIYSIRYSVWFVSNAQTCISMPLHTDHNPCESTDEILSWNTTIHIILWKIRNYEIAKDWVLFHLQKASAELWLITTYPQLVPFGWNPLVVPVPLYINCYSCSCFSNDTLLSTYMFFFYWKRTIELHKIWLR